MLRLGPEDRLVDLGGGTGMYAADILKQVSLRHRIVLVDPFPEMLAQVPKDLPIDCVEMDAVAFSARPATYDKILIKEAVHHIKDRAALFGNLFERLSSGGVLLLVHIPPRIEYPLFRAALERSLTWHADPRELVRLLSASGFSVERDRLDYRHVLPKDHYLNMVENRYMSLLSSFDDNELAAGLEEMDHALAGCDELAFTDHFDYIAAIKP